MTTSQEWIEQSLARLEQAEAERDSHEHALETITDPEELRAHSEAIDRLDAEITSLYTKLEAAAAEAEGEEAGEPVEPAPQPEPTPAAAAPAPAPEPAPAVQPAPADYDPFGPPPATAAPPEAAAPVAAGADFGSSDFGSDFGGGYDTFDEPKPGGGLKWMVLALVVIGGGGFGAYTMMSQSTPAPAAPTAAENPAKVISATPVPPDTQGPKVAKGGEADRTPGTAIRSSSRRRGGGGGQKAAPGEQESKVKVQDTKDPLGGIE